MSQNIKEVKFEWKEIFKTDMEIAYRVTCKISGDDGRNVETNEILKLNKVAPIFLSQENSPSLSKSAEASAYKSAVELFKASGNVQ